jgi:hypothetical protein
MKKNNFTLVTGLWDLGRGELKDFGRSFEHYLECFSKLLSLDVNLCIWAPKELNEFILTRAKGNVRIVNRELSDFDNWFGGFEQVQRIRLNPDWYGQAGWLSESPQCKLKYYNPIVMSKFFMLNDTTYHNPFGTEYFFWIDAGLTNTVNIDLISEVKKLPYYMKEIEDKLLFLSFPYNASNEVHGFEADKFYEYCGQKTSYVCRGGFFGGSAEKIRHLNGDYYGYMFDSLSKGYMGTEENFHTMLTYRHPDKTHRFELEPNGLVYKFFDHLSAIEYEDTSNATLIPYDKRKDVLSIKTSLYVLTYNSPNQFEALCNSYLKTEPNFLQYPRKILVDNSTDLTTYQKYNSLCKTFGFEHIKKEENIGICGGRQFVAEHFNESDSEYYIFLEDDMNLHEKSNQKCKSEYDVWVENLYEKSLEIIHKERYDFLKLSFSEFFGSNDVQWSWYNVPQDVRRQYFPNKPNLPEHGLDPDPPLLKQERIKRYKDLKYIEGDYYYCNWPIWFSRVGNKKVFLDVKWAHPYEQVWMSHVFQLQKKRKVKSAVLALSPINHDRFDFYPAEERVES